MKNTFFMSVVRRTPREHLLERASKERVVVFAEEIISQYVRKGVGYERYILLSWYTVVLERKVLSCFTDVFLTRDRKPFEMLFHTWIAMIVRCD